MKSCAIPKAFRTDFSQFFCSLEIGIAPRKEEHFVEHGLQIRAIGFYKRFYLNLNNYSNYKKITHEKANLYYYHIFFY
ncbi:hypothetical protein ASC72_08415 [Flavobacterium sp. Root420]|nr:hypothetical protein ASC72_08415 [Flavobacterium sp. Root420]